MDNYTRAAALAALLFSLHPLRVESVAWVTERRDLLSGFFALATLLAYLRAHTSPPAPNRRWLAASAGLYALALLSKEICVAWVGTLFLIDCYPLKRPQQGVPWRRLIGEKTAHLAMAASAMVLVLLATAHVEGLRSLSEHGWISRLSQAGFGFWFYAVKSIFPVHLAPLYPFPGPLDDFDPIARILPLYILGSGVLLLLLMQARRRCPPFWYAGLHYGMLLLPVLGTMETFSIANDRFSYLSCMGWAVLAGGGLLWLRQRHPRLASAGAAMGLLCLAMLTRNQCRIWKDSSPLWGNVLRNHPTAVLAHHNLGAFLHKHKDPAKATRRLRHALRVHPLHPLAHLTLGQILQEGGEPDAALRHYRMALAARGGEGPAHLKIGRLLAEEGRLAEAEGHLREALRQEEVEETPYLAEAFANLGTVLALQDRLPEAIECWDRALALDPSLEEVRRNRERALAESESRK
jgi:tetratricopeptide (TPR) repeat protein